MKRAFIGHYWLQLIHNQRESEREREREREREGKREIETERDREREREFHSSICRAPLVLLQMTLVAAA
jgi:hypothetical protein